MLTLSKVVRAAFSTASKLLELQLREDGAEGDDEGARPEDQASFLSQLGVAVRPVVASTLRALTFDDGDDTLVVKLVDKARSPTDLAVGETRVFACGELAVSVRCLAANRIEISANGGVVTFNGGSTPVAKEGSATTGHTHGPGGLQVVIPTGSSAGTYAVTGVSGSATDTIATGAGSQNIKVP